MFVRACKLAPPDGQVIVVTALTMALGWRIRGQFGHELGAALAGALAATALALMAGREEWWRRIHYFAFFGALGWAFGGSMSYMKVVGYCHSSDAATVLYGFAALFLLGFLWSALGGGGTGLAAVLDSQRLASVFPVTATVFAGWLLQDIATDLAGIRSEGGPLGAPVVATGLARYEADWVAPLVAAAAAGMLAVVRKRMDFGISLVLHLVAGWWAGFGLLVLALGLRLNPPRGDNWAGCLGLLGGLLLFCHRHGLRDVARVALTTGVLGGCGFCLGQMLKLAFIATGVQWGWHAVMEWFHGLFFGTALALAMMPLLRSAAVPSDNPPRWTAIFAIVFVLGALPYLNFRKSPLLWLKHVSSLPVAPFGIPLVGSLLPSRGFLGWFDSVYLLAAAVLAVLLVRHSRTPIPLIPAEWQGRGQLLFLVLLWVATLMSYVHEVPVLAPEGLAMQWGLTLNALLCSLLVLACRPAPAPAPQAEAVPGRWARRWVAAALAAWLVATMGGWALKRTLFGDSFAGYFYMNHIRFGPNNTNERR